MGVERRGAMGGYPALGDALYTLGWLGFESKPRLTLDGQDLNPTCPNLVTC